jgi:hypothetical protein
MYKHLFYTLILISFYTQVLSQEENIYVTSDKVEYEQRLKLYNDSLRAYNSDNQSISMDWKKNGYRLSSEEEVAQRNGVASLVYWQKYGIRVYEYYVKVETIERGSCVCEGYTERYVFIGIFKRPVQRIVYKQSKINMEELPIKKVVDLLKDSIYTDMILAAIIVNDWPKVPSQPFIKESFNGFTASGLPRYDKDAKSWVIIDEGYEQQWAPKGIKGE